MIDYPNPFIADSDDAPQNDFVDRHAPTHPAHSGFAEANAPQMARSPEFGELGPRPEEVRTPQTLVDMYLNGDFTKLFADTKDRPEHYTPRQREIVEARHLGRDLNPEPTTAEINDLVLELVRATDTAKKSRDIIQRVTTPDVADVAEFGDSFEDQDFGPLIEIM
jgi:hypothetical protein